MAGTTSKIPATHRALVNESTSKPLQLSILPTPKPTPGSVIVRVEGTTVVPHAREIATGVIPFTYPTPFIPGSVAVGRIVALGSGATTLRVGDRVLTETFLRARDNEDVLCMQGMHDGGWDASQKLVEDQEEYRNGTYAEYAKVAMENCHKIPETLANVKLSSWLWLGQLLVPFGGLTNEGGVDLKPGETVVIAPATGCFTGAGVQVALAMGAKVVAVGRNEDALKRLEGGLEEYRDRLRTVRVTSDMDAQTLANAIGPVDCFLDLSPPSAANSIHRKACIVSLKRRGRACFMGGIEADVTIPHGPIYRNNLQITGKWMYERRATGMLFKMVEVGVLKLGGEESWSFRLDQWKEAYDAAAAYNRWGQIVLFEF